MYPSGFDRMPDVHRAAPLLRDVTSVDGRVADEPKEQEAYGNGYGQNRMGAGIATRWSPLYFLPFLTRALQLHHIPVMNTIDRGKV